MNMEVQMKLNHYGKVVSNIEEIKARKGKIIAGIQEICKKYYITNYTIDIYGKETNKYVNVQQSKY